MCPARQRFLFPGRKERMSVFSIAIVLFLSYRLSRIRIYIQKRHGRLYCQLIPAFRLSHCPSIKDKQHLQSPCQDMIYSSTMQCTMRDTHLRWTLPLLYLLDRFQSFARFECTKITFRKRLFLNKTDIPYT